MSKPSWKCPTCGDDLGQVVVDRAPVVYVPIYGCENCRQAWLIMEFQDSQGGKIVNYNVELN